MWGENLACKHSDKTSSGTSYGLIGHPATLLNKRAISEHCKLGSGTFRPHCESVLTCAGGQFLGSQHGELQVTSVAELSAAPRRASVQLPEAQLHSPASCAFKN